MMNSVTAWYKGLSSDSKRVINYAAIGSGVTILLPVHMYVGAIAGAALGTKTVVGLIRKAVGSDKK